MDKELLRIVIITLGVLVMIGMILWSFFKDNRSRREIDFYDEGDPLDKIDDSLVIKTDNDDFDIVPIGGPEEELVIDDLYDEVNREYESPPQPDFDSDLVSDSVDDLEKQTDFEDSGDLSSISDINEFSIQEPQYPDDVEETTEAQSQPQQPEYTKAIKIPEIIQVHILALDYEGFTGRQLLEVFQLVKLTYGSLKIFEKLDKNRRVQYSVASMVEPGTFPDTGAELKNFKCPGIVFFLQPGEIEDSISVFNEYIDTIDLVAEKLDGVKLDSKRDPLTKKTIDAFRMALSN